jgi:hypothetical protein
VVYSNLQQAKVARLYLHLCAGALRGRLSPRTLGKNFACVINLLGWGALRYVRRHDMCVLAASLLTRVAT